jgi:hypothetical protein
MPIKRMIPDLSRVVEHRADQFAQDDFFLSGK